MPRRTDNRDNLSAFCSIELGDRLHAYCRIHQLSRSEAIRRLLKEGLDRAGVHATPDNATQLDLDLSAVTDG